MKVLDNHIAGKKYVVGTTLTIADIELVSALVLPMKFLFEDKFRKNFQNLTKWFEGIVEEPTILKSFGKVRLCQKQLTADHHTHHAHAAHGHHDKKEGEKKHEKKEEKKHEKKEEKKEKKKDQDSGEEDEPKVKSEKNPLDSLPPSTFNLFDFKTLFVNAPNKKEACDFFWKNYDNAGYSIYWV